MQIQCEITPTVESGEFEIGLVVCTYNRPLYLWRSLRSLRASLSGLNVIVAIVDDASSSVITRKLVRSFPHGQIPTTTLIKTKRSGFSVHSSLRMGWDYLLEHHNCRFLSNVDSDVVMKPGWLQTIRDLYIRERASRGPLIVTGFNTDKHPALETHSDFLIKESIGGLNTFFDDTLYKEIVRPVLEQDHRVGAGWDWELIRALQSNGYPILSTRPSVLQHIGKLGKYSHRTCYDKAQDY